jgi:hypothetical protein
VNGLSQLSETLNGSQNPTLWQTLELILSGISSKAQNIPKDIFDSLICYYHIAILGMDFTSINHIVT